MVLLSSSLKSKWGVPTMRSSKSSNRESGSGSESGSHNDGAACEVRYDVDINSLRKSKARMNMEEEEARCTAAHLH